MTFSAHSSADKLLPTPLLKCLKDSCAFPGLLLAEIFRVLPQVSQSFSLLVPLLSPAIPNQTLPTCTKLTPGKAAESKHAKCHRNRNGRGEMPLGWSSASFVVSTCVTDTKVSGGHSWERAVPSGMCLVLQGRGHTEPTQFRLC